MNSLKPVRSSRKKYFILIAQQINTIMNVPCFGPKPKKKLNHTIVKKALFLDTQLGNKNFVKRLISCYDTLTKATV